MEYLKARVFFHEPFLGFSANNQFFGITHNKYGIADIPIMTYLFINLFVEFLPSIRPNPSVLSDSVGFRKT